VNVSSVLKRMAADMAGRVRTDQHGTWVDCPACGGAYVSQSRQVSSHVSWHAEQARNFPHLFWSQTQALHGCAVVPMTTVGDPARATLDRLWKAFPDYWRSDHLYAVQFLSEQRALVQRARIRIDVKGRRGGKLGVLLVPSPAYTFLLDLFHNGVEWDEILAIYRSMGEQFSKPEAA
jgi:hypothetical protein